MSECKPLLSGMRHDEAAAVIEALPPHRQVSILHEMGDGAVFNLTAGLGRVLQLETQVDSASASFQRL